MGKSKLHHHSGERASRGQSLVEILIALAVGGMLVTTAVTLMAVVLRVSSQNAFLRDASSLNEELMEKVSVYAERQWYCANGPAAGCGVYNLSKGPSNTYRLLGVGGRLDTQTCSVLPPGTCDQIPLNDAQYTRYFYAQNVCRSGEDIVGVTDTTCPAGQEEDPSTQFVTVTTSWATPQGVPGELTFKKYLTRSRNVVFQQSDWSGGAGQAGPITAPNNKFDSATDINSAVGGQISLP